MEKVFVLQNTVVIHIVNSFILWIFLFYFGFYILQAHEKELEWKQITLEPRWSTVGSAMLNLCTLVSNLLTELHHTVNGGTSARHQVVVSELQDSVSIEIPLLKHSLLIFCYQFWSFNSAFTWANITHNAFLWLHCINFKNIYTTIQSIQIQDTFENVG